MKILLTGGAGYIGSIVAEKLITQGHDVVVVDSCENGHRAAVSGSAALIVANLAEHEKLYRVLCEYEIEAVMHFAAHSLVGESMRDPALYLVNNVSNSLSLSEAMRRAGIRKMVFSSTAAVYGEPEETPIAESHPCIPINTYGETKLFFENALKRYHEAYGFEYVSLRYFNAAGASRERGEDHRPETHLIPLILKSALEGNGEVRIFGDDYHTPDGTCIRDYIHVEDLADAHILALNCTGANVFNLGNGRGFSVRQVVQAAARVTGRRIETETAPRRPGDPPVLVADSSRFQQETGWRPKKPELDEIIGSAWRWMEKHPRGYE